jgi:hypothetical protein
MLLSYPTKKGGVFTISDFTEDDKKVIGFCSICSQDEELFPEPFILPVHAVSRGNIRCGCTANFVYSYDQYMVMCSRIINENVTFLGLAGNYNKDKIYPSADKVLLRCEKHNVEWSTKNVYNYLRTPANCKICVKEFMSDCKSIDWVGESKVHPTSGSILCVVAEVGVDVEYTCSVCSLDTELFPTPFKISKGGWRNPDKGCCGCNTNRKWTPEQYLVKCLREDASRKDSTFIRIIPEYDGTVRYNSKVELGCDLHENHGTWSTGSIEKYIYRHDGCPICARLNSYFGLYENRLSDFDNLYLLRFTSKLGDDESFIKIGRTFDIPERVGDFLKHYSVDIIDTVQDIHLLVYIRETSMHQSLTNYSYSPTINFGGSVRECYVEDVLNSTLVNNTFKL